MGSPGLRQWSWRTPPRSRRSSSWRAGALPAGGQLWLPSLPRIPTDRTSCWSARRPRRPQGQAAARGGGSLRINEKGHGCTESQMQHAAPQSSSLLALLRSARLLPASTPSARPADTLPRLVAGLYTLHRDLTSSGLISVPTPCSRIYSLVIIVTLTQLPRSKRSCTSDPRPTLLR